MSNYQNGQNSKLTKDLSEKQQNENAEDKEHKSEQGSTKDSQSNPQQLHQQQIQNQDQSHLDKNISQQDQRVVHDQETIFKDNPAQDQSLQSNDNLNSQRDQHQKQQNQSSQITKVSQEEQNLKQISMNEELHKSQGKKSDNQSEQQPHNNPQLDKKDKLKYTDEEKFRSQQHPFNPQLDREENHKGNDDDSKSQQPQVDQKQKHKDEDGESIGSQQNPQQNKKDNPKEKDDPSNRSQKPQNNAKTDVKDKLKDKDEEIQQHPNKDRKENHNESKGQQPQADQKDKRKDESINRSENQKTKKEPEVSSFVNDDESHMNNHPKQQQSPDQKNNSYQDRNEKEKIQVDELKVPNENLSPQNIYQAQDEVYDAEELDDELEFVQIQEQQKSDNKQKLTSIKRDRQQNKEQRNKEYGNNDSDYMDSEVNGLLNGADSEVYYSQDMINIENGLKISPNKQKKESPKKIRLSLEEKRNAHLQEVYTFYCKQTYVQGKQATFDRLSQESSIMSIGKFMYFTRDFKLMDLDPEEEQHIQNLIFSQFPEWPQIKLEIAQYQEQKRLETERRKYLRNEKNSKNFAPKNLMEDQKQPSQTEINQTLNTVSEQDLVINKRTSDKGVKTTKIENSQEKQLKEVRNKTNQSDQEETTNPIQVAVQKNSPSKLVKNSKQAFQSESEDQPIKFKKNLVYKIENTLSKTNLTEIFRKSSSNNKYLTFEEFNEGLNKLAQFIFFKQLWQAKNWKKFDKKIKDSGQKQRIDDEQIFTFRGPQIDEESKKQLQELALILLYKFIEIDDVNKFRTKMKSVRKPFEMKDDTERVQADELKVKFIYQYFFKKKYQFKLYHPDIKNKEKLQEELDKRKEEKEKNKHIEQEKKDYYKLQQLLKFYTAQKLQEMFPDKKETIDKLIRIRNQERLKNQQVIFKPEQKTKITKYRSQSMKEPVNRGLTNQIDKMLIDWENLDQGYLKDFKSDHEALQLVSTLVKNVDNEDNIYLAEYQIEENPFKAPKNNKIEKYGKKQTIQSNQNVAQPISRPSYQNQNNYNNINYDMIRFHGQQQNNDLISQIELAEKQMNYRSTPSPLLQQIKKRNGSINQGVNDYQNLVQYDQNLNKRQYNASSIQTQNINHIPVYQYQQPQLYPKQSNVYGSQISLRPENFSPQKQQKNQSVETMIRAKQIEIDEKRRQDLLLGQVLKNQKNREGKMLAKIY